MRRAVARRGARPLLAGAALSAVGGCAPPPAPLPADVDSTAVLRRLLNTDNGLQVHRWTVDADAGAVAQAMARHRRGAALAAPAAAALRRDGLRFVRVRAGDLDALFEELGVTAAVAAWHGQVHRWRELLRRPVGPGGVAVAVAGRVRRLEPGTLRLLARSWTVLMEDGPCLNLEIVAEFVPPRPWSYRRLLGGSEPDGTRFDSARLEGCLEPGFAYVLAAESPAADWEGDATAAPGAPPLGPEVDAPVALGRSLLNDPGRPPTRTMLVFVPRIPQRLLRPYGSAVSTEPVSRR